MASSKANMVKCIKAIGTYDASEPAEAVDGLDEEQQKSLSALAKSVYNNLKSVNTGEFEPKESKSKKTSNSHFGGKIKLGSLQNTKSTG
jgi:hypothetical protein